MRKAVYIIPVLLSLMTQTSFSQKKCNWPEYNKIFEVSKSKNLTTISDYFSKLDGELVLNTSKYDAIENVFVKKYDYCSDNSNQKFSVRVVNFERPEGPEFWIFIKTKNVSLYNNLMNSITIYNHKEVANNRIKFDITTRPNGSQLDAVDGLRVAFSNQIGENNSLDYEIWFLF